MKRLHQVMRDAAERTAQRVRMAFRGKLSRLDATVALPQAQVEGLAGETVAAELMQHYGFASAPIAGAEVVLLPIGGNSGHTIIIATVDGRYRVSLKPGEVAIHTDEGDHVHMQRGRIIEVVTETLLVKAGTKVRFETPVVEMSQDLQVEANAHADGDVSDGTRSMAEDRQIFNGHTHPVSGNTTAAPTQKE
jgi:phage baseplate assembly protein V